MNDFEELFANLTGGRVLDAATGEGGFVDIMQTHLEGCSSIVGIDTSEEMVARAHKRFNSPGRHFMRMDAGHIGFRAKSFDTVSIGVSLHHLVNVNQTLSDMKRVLKPGGTFIICEMHRDGISAAQFNSIRIHHWAAGVDSALGIVHDRTYARKEILDFIDELNLQIVTVRDLPHSDLDPMDDEAIKSVERYIEQYCKSAEAIPDGEVFIDQGEELRRSLHITGIQREPVLVVIGENQ